ncbi:hypothetical protein RIF29_20580 [Crotalaria pallida]|uniref:Uncharacterized protein n=1 Tax=Crotalaria pallida TaxID=3830 RepID=A0AAN9F1H1_CROPI
MAKTSKSNPLEAKAKENAIGKRKYVRRKRLNMYSTPPIETAAALTEPAMQDSTKMARRSFAGRENLTEHISKHNNSMKQALSSCMPLSEDTQAPSTSPLKSNPSWGMLNANSGGNKSKRNDQATAQDGHENGARLLTKSAGQSKPNDFNISNSQTSMIMLQMVGSKRNHSSTFNSAVTSSLNEMRAHYNGFPSYQTKFRVQFPNVQKKC